MYSVNIIEKRIILTGAPASEVLDETKNPTSYYHLPTTTYKL